MFYAAKRVTVLPSQKSTWKMWVNGIKDQLVQADVENQAPIRKFPQIADADTQGSGGFLGSHGDVRR